jgi:RNA polymerase sigma-70 factor, ECF subfamily
MPGERPWWGRRRAIGSGRIPLPLEGRETSDEELMAQLAAGREEALGPLYTRYAARIFGLASQSLERTAAEEVVQDVFLAIWRNAGTFRPERGRFRPWMFQIAHNRVLNELRRRSRQPVFEFDPEGARLAAMPDPDPDPEEAVWRTEERDRLRSALEALPAAQRRALDLAYFEELSHPRVAERLGVPLGTTKTRIRAGLQKLRASLSSAVAGLILGIIGLTILASLWYGRDRAELALDERALSLLTSSETVTIRLAAVAGIPRATHAIYRGRAGATIAVVTFSNFPRLEPGHVYEAWVRHGSVWTSMGATRPDASGHARLIAEGPQLAELPDEIEVTREAAGNARAPSGPVIVRAGSLRSR